MAGSFRHHAFVFQPYVVVYDWFRLGRQRLSRLAFSSQYVEQATPVATVITHASH